MHTRAELLAPVAMEDLFRCVDDLGAYPAWLSIIRTVQTVQTVQTVHSWSVLLEARVGPFRRGKLLRMERTAHEIRPQRCRARFERRELDGRDHAEWILDALVAPAEGGSSLTMDLTYGGRLWAPPVEAVLATVIELARPRLIACATRTTPASG